MMLNNLEIHERLSSALARIENKRADVEAVDEMIDELYGLLGSVGDLDDALRALREPFPATMIGKLPRVTCGACSQSRTRNCDKHSKRECPQCGNYVSTAHMHLDYVGHAAVTDRLNAVDPSWTLDPMARDEFGNPKFDGNGGVWFYITVLGVTRPCYGDAEGKRGGDAVKAALSDAIKNGAMRFGVGIDLWSKQDLLEINPPTVVEEPKPKRHKQRGDNVDWAARIKAANDLDSLRIVWNECGDAGLLEGEVKADFLARRAELESGKEPALAAV